MYKPKNKIIIRIQSSDGTRRIQCSLNENISDFLRMVQEAFNLSDLKDYKVCRERNDKSEIKSTLSLQKLSDIKIRHGDMLYLVPRETQKEDFVALTPQPMESEAVQGHISSINFTNPLFQEDEVDSLLFKQDGYIHRERDEKLCSHGHNAKCMNCLPIEPYNEDYMKEHNIRHMSFHAYLQKLIGGANKGKFAALENISCKIKAGCKEHAPWPAGICTKCQPSAITLNRQRYRHVDNVMFENTFLVERFLDYWRCTGHQRLGYLYGRYEIHKDVPLGIKASVVAIYEPPQEGTKDSIRLLPDDRAELVDAIAKSLGLQKVGWIFTDLIAEDRQKGTVKHLRNSNTYFLSAQECIMAGYFQNQHPNPCRLSSDGYFGSKFATVCVTGDQDNHVHMEGYQVSNQCMALVKHNCLIPTKDAPELAYVKESSNEQYIPDVFYKDKDNYGNEISKLARPFPVEYLLLDVPASTPVEPQYTFIADSTIRSFPVENRLIDGHIQDFNALIQYMNQFTKSRFLDALSDFHVLLYIATMDMLPLKDHLEPLLEAVKTKNQELALNWSRSEHWATVEHIMAAQENSPSLPHLDTSVDVGGSSNPMWTCRFCTFLNQPSSEVCEMCGLPH